MATSLAEHFEGTVSQSKTKRWLFIGGGAVLFCLLAMFVKSTLPTPRAEFVGTWYGMRAGTFYDLREDGTYRSVVLEDFIGSNPSLRIEATGRWKASHEALYLTTANIRSVNKPKDRSAFETYSASRLSNEIKLPIHWTTKTKWSIAGQPFERKG